MQELTIFHQKIGFVIKFYVYIQILRSVGAHGGRNIKNLMFSFFLKTVGLKKQGLTPSLRVLVGIGRKRINTRRIQLNLHVITPTLWKVMNKNLNSSTSIDFMSIIARA